MKKSNQQKQDFRHQFVFMKPMRIGRTKTGNILIYVNQTTGISISPNYLKAILAADKKAS